MRATVKKMYFNDDGPKPWTKVITTDGQQIGAWGNWNPVARQLAPGDEIEYEAQQKGKYSNFTSLAKAGESPASGPDRHGRTPQGGGRHSDIEKDVGVLRRQVLDLYLAGEKDIAKCLDIVMDIDGKVRERLADAGSEVVDTQLAGLIHKLDPDGDPGKGAWKAHLDRLEKTTKDRKAAKHRLIGDIESVVSGKMEFAFSPDGEIAFSKKG